jgi:hypothetical protein
VKKKSNRLTPRWQNTRGFNAVTKKLVQSVERFYFEHSFTRRAQRDGSMLPLLEAFSENSFRDSLARRRHDLLNVTSQILFTSKQNLFCRQLKAVGSQIC